LLQIVLGSPFLLVTKVVTVLESDPELVELSPPHENKPVATKEDSINKAALFFVNKKRMFL
jgi:hypothetical protein